MRRLITIPISHYCEKARWALDRAGLHYREERHLQMLHWPHAWAAGGGRTVPVLVADGQSYPESADILRYADAQLDEASRLYPAGIASAVAELEHEFDADFGVESRRIFYASLSLPGGRALLAINAHGAPRWEAALLWLSFPVARGMLSRYLGVSPATVQRAKDRVSRTLDDVAERLRDGRPYLFGERFTAADLAFAALSAPLSLPSNYGIPLPTRAVAKAHDPNAGQFWEHPAVAFALRMYATQREATTMGQQDPAGSEPPGTQ